MKKKNLICGLLALTLIFSGCSKKSDTTNKAASVGERPPVAQDMAISDSKSNGVSPGASAGGAKEAAKTENIQEKKIIMNGTVYIVEEDLVKLSNSLHKKAEEVGGYIENESVGEEKLIAKVRIPSNKFDDFMSYTEKGFTVKNKNISSENITDAYVDNEARLKNLRAQEEQVLTILKKANTVEEVLKVQAELYKIRGEAEALEAKKKSWDKQVDYASITISADRKMIVADNKKTIIGGSDFIKSIGKGFTNTSVSFILAIEHILIFIFSNIIILVILAAAGIFGYKKYKKYMKNNK